MLKRLFILLLLMTSTVIVAQDQNQFEGIVVYHRTSPDNSQAQGIVTAFFKGYKHKVVSQFLTDTSIEHYTTYYDFEQYPNTSFKRKECGNIQKIDLQSSSSTLPHVVDSQNVEYVKGYPCYKLEFPYDDGIWEASVVKYLSKDHSFKLPYNTSFDGYILSQRHENIPLKMIETYQFSSGAPTFTIVKEAVLIIQTSLSNSIFEIPGEGG